MKRWLAGFMLLTACLPCAVWAQAAPWPSKPVRQVLPYGPGGASDIVARLIAESLTQALGQPFIVENRPGAGQNIGTAAVVQAAPDGYTLLLASEIIVAEHVLDKTTPFVVMRDLAPVSRIAGRGSMIVVPGNFPAKSLAEFVKVVRASPGKYNFATINNFELPEMVDFRDRLKLDMVLVAYKTGPAAQLAVVTGESHMLAGSADEALTNSQGPRGYQVIAYTGTSPHYLFPNVPTVAGTGVGLNDFEATFAFTMFVPTGTPTNIVNRLHAALSETVKKPDVAKRFRDLGYETFSPGIPELTSSLNAKIKQIESMMARGLKLR